MRTWFLSKVKYAKETEQGLLKDITEQYLIDAVSFTECEATIYDRLGSMIRGDFQIVSIARSPVVDTFLYDDSDIWWKCKMRFMTVDFHSGKEKVTNQIHLVTAEDAKQAYERIIESMSNMQVGFTIPEVVKTEIIEVFPYENDKFEKKEKGLTKVTMKHINAEGESEEMDITDMLDL